MSRLDQHVSLVRNKMAMGRFLAALAWAVILFGSVVFLAILAARLLLFHLPREIIWFWAGLVITVVTPLVLAIRQRPTAHEAAVAIDEKLALKEKFSTALYVRPSLDPFAAAAVKDAEATADAVSLHKRFPIEFPRAAAGAFLVALIALLTGAFLGDHPLFGSDLAPKARLALEKRQRADAERSIKGAIATIDTAPREVADKEEIQIARKDLTDLLRRPMADPQHAQRRAAAALQELTAVKQKIKDNQNYATAQNEMKQMKSISPPVDDPGPVADAHRAIARGDFAEAVEDLKTAVKKFDKMDQKDQEKAAAQMKNLAQQMQQMAANQQLQQQMQKQLQQMGASQQQAQQMTQAMQQAAQGNPQAQQQVQQMAKQLTQQMNQQAGLSQKQQQQIAQQVRQSVQKMQQQANGQSQAQQMSQAAQQLAQAMQQAAQAGQSGGQQQQQAKGGQPSGQQQAGGSQQQSALQQMAQAGQSMQQQLQQMQAVANDGQAVAAQQQQGGQGSKQGQNPNGSGQGQKQGQGQWAQGNPQQQQGQGQGGDPAQATGKRPDPTEAAFGVKQEVDPSQANDKGKILASTFVKSSSLRGESKVGLSDVVTSADQDATDEVDQDRVPRAAQKAVKDYFETLKHDAQ